MDQSGTPKYFSSLGQVLTSLKPDGTFNPGALNVEIDLPVGPYHTPGGQSRGYVRIWGLSIKDLGAAFNLNPVQNGVASTMNATQIVVSGGMSAGFPLANPTQARALVKGQVYQAYGNWIGVDQTVDLLISPASGTIAAPLNLTLNWMMNQPLSAALMQCFSTGFPQASVEIDISPRLVQNHDEPSVYGTLTQLASYLNPVSKKIITDTDYPGVGITYDGATIKVFDSTTMPPPVQIAPQDLIGQPTWIQPQMIQMKTVMRGDLDIGSIVTLPPTIVGATSGASPGLSGNPSNNMSFTGNFQVVDIHHFGNFRQPDAASWNTTVNMIKQPSTPTS